jgi:hypothetical protein
LLIQDNEIDNIIAGRADANLSTLNILNLLQLLADKSDNKILEKEKIKQYKNVVLNKVVANTVLPLNNTILFGDSMYSGQIFKSSDEFLSRENAIANNLPVINYSECEAKLKRTYNMTKTHEIIYMTSRTDFSNNQNSSSYDIYAYDNISKKRLDLNYCENTTNIVELPLTATNGLNMTLYNEMKKQGVDIFNSDDPFFNDICFTYIDNNTNSDVSLSWRRSNIYMQKKPMCIGLNCTYNGINEINYISCNCTGLGTESDLIDSIVDLTLTSLSEFNLRVIYCYNLVLTVIYY